MIAKVAKQGSSMGGLVNYLLGPGRGEETGADEHVGQRVVAMSSDITDIAAGQRLEGGERRALGMQLGLYGQMFPQSCPAQGGVYHVVFSLAAGEHLEDAHWAAVAEDVAKVLHLERPSGAVGSWAAFCHGPSEAGFEHMHFTASLVRSDGSEVKTYLRNGYAELHDVARRAEERHGLTVVAGRDHGSLPVAERAEQEACAKRGRSEPERDMLARVVRSAAAAVKSEAEFPVAVREAGMLIRPRYGAGGRSEVVGYSVAVPAVKESEPERAKRESGGKPEAKPVWFGGGKLGRDLTLPALRARWESTVAEGNQGQEDGRGGEVAAARSEALPRWAGRRPRADFSMEAAMVAAGRNQLGGKAWGRAAERLEVVGRLAGDPSKVGTAQWRSLAWEAAGATSSLARRIEVDGPGPLAAAAKHLALASQRPVRAAELDDDSHDRRSRLRGVASVCSAHQLGASGQHAEGWLRVVRELARLADSLARAAAARDELTYEATLTAAASGELHAAHARLVKARPAHLSATKTDFETPVGARNERGHTAQQAPSVGSEAGPLTPSSQPDLDRNDGPDLGR